MVPFPLGPIVAAVIICATVTVEASGAFTLLKDYSGTAFFDGFDFFTDRDPTNGCVDFVDKSTAFASGLAGVDANSGQAFMRVDHMTVLGEPRLAVSGSAAPPPPPRRSVRVTSRDMYDPKNLSGSADGLGAVLAVLDLHHMPTGCGTWPAFWLNSGKGHWPQYGEIDIIEGVHETTHTQTTLHTSTGCQQAEVPTTNFTGEWARHAGQPATNCYVHAYSPKGNLGCPIAGPPNSMGTPFNTNGGGVYAMLWNHHQPGPDGHSGEKKMWFWDRDHIPADLKLHEHLRLRLMQ